MKLNIAEAAKHAEVSESTVWKWLRQNKLTRHSLSNRTLVDLEELDLILDEDTRPTPTPQLLSVILLRLEKLEREVEFLRHIQTKAPIVELSDEQCKLIYRSVQSYLRPDGKGDSGLNLALIGACASEEVLERIMELEGDDQPWKPFLSVLSYLTNYYKRHAEYSTRTDIQKNYNECVRLKSEFRTLAMIFINMSADKNYRDSLCAGLPLGSILESEVLRRSLSALSRKPNPADRSLPNDIGELLRESISIWEEKEIDGNSANQLRKRLSKAVSMLK
jgi:transposase-like protein